MYSKLRHRVTISRACARLIFVLSAGLFALPAAAGSLQVDPVKVEITGDRKIGSVRVRNDASTPATVRVHALRWTQENGDDAYGAAPQVIVSPPIFTIPAGATQLVRVGLRGAATRSAYRLILEEVPGPGPAGGVQVALRINMPLYVLEQPGALSDLRWNARQQAGRWVVEARNSGPGYVRVEGADATRATGIEMAAGLLGTILPGATRRWELGAAPAITDRAQFERIKRPVGGDEPAKTAAKR